MVKRDKKATSDEKKRADGGKEHVPSAAAGDVVGEHGDCSRNDDNGNVSASGNGDIVISARVRRRGGDISPSRQGGSNEDSSTRHGNRDVSLNAINVVERLEDVSSGGGSGTCTTRPLFQGLHGATGVAEVAHRSFDVAASSMGWAAAAGAEASSDFETGAPAMKRQKISTNPSSCDTNGNNNFSRGEMNSTELDELDDRKPAAKQTSVKPSHQYDSNSNISSENRRSRKKSTKSSENSNTNRMSKNIDSGKRKRKELAPSLAEYLRPGGFKKYDPRPEWCHFSTTTALTSATDETTYQDLNGGKNGVASVNNGEASTSGDVIEGSLGDGGLQHAEGMSGLSTFHYSSPNDSVPMNTYGLPTLPPGFFANGDLTRLALSGSTGVGPTNVNVDGTIDINNNNFDLAQLGNILATSNINGGNREMIEFFARDLNQSIDAFLAGQRQEQQQQQQQLQMQQMMQEQEHQLQQNEQYQQQQGAEVVLAGAGAGGGGGGGDSDEGGDGDESWNHDEDDGDRNNERNDNGIENGNEAANENDHLDRYEDQNGEDAPNANENLAAAAVPRNNAENQPPQRNQGQVDIENLYPILSDLSNVSNRTIQQLSVAIMAGMESASTVPDRHSNALVSLLNAAGVPEAESEAISAQAIAAAEAEIRAQREDRNNRRAENNVINGDNNGRNLNAAVDNNAGIEHRHNHDAFDADESLAAIEPNQPDNENLARGIDRGRHPLPQQGRRHRGHRPNVHNVDGNEQHQQQEQNQHMLMNPQNLAPIAEALGGANIAQGAQGGVPLNFNVAGQLAEPHVVRVLERAVNWWMWRRQQQQLQQNVAAMGGEGRAVQDGENGQENRDVGEVLSELNRSIDAPGTGAMVAPLSIPNKVAVFGTEYDTALHLAIKEHATDAALHLIHSGACVHFPNARGVTPLILASQKGNIAVVRELLRKGAMPNASTITGSTAFIQACHFGRLSVVEELLRYGAKVEQANYKNTTALMRASQEGHDDVVRLLLKNNASVNRRNDDKMTALMLSSQRGHAGIVKMLIRAGAEVDAKTAQESTSLMLACKRRHLQVAKILVAHGTELMLKDSKGSTVLETAIRKGRTEFAKILTGASQLELMKEEIGRERSFEMVRIWTLLQWERAHICVGASNVTIHKVAENKSDPILNQLSESNRALVLAMSLPAPQIELVSSFIPLPRVWDDRIKLLTSRCHVHPDTGVFGALDLIDEVLEEGGLLEAFDIARVDPPPSFTSWSDFGAWCRRCDVILSKSDGGVVIKENQFMLDSSGVPRKVASALNQRRRANYLAVLAYAPPALTSILLRPPYGMPGELLNKLKAEHDLQSVVRRLGIEGIHFDSIVGNELVSIASSLILWCKTRHTY